MANTSYSHEALEAKAAAAEKRVKDADARIARLRREIKTATRLIAKIETWKAQDATFAAKARKQAARNRKADAAYHAKLGCRA